MSRPVDRRRCVGAVVLAAGGSRRLGRAKQLIVVGGRTLLDRTIAAAIDAGADPVIVVLGSRAQEIKRAHGHLAGSVRFVVNEDWQEGMGNSLARGVRELGNAAPGVAGALILVCDQPALDADLLRRFLEAAAAEPANILVADYGAERGPPVLFPRAHFDDLMTLRGDTGAREILRRHAGILRTIPFPAGADDIDTPEDLKPPPKQPGPV